MNIAITGANGFLGSNLCNHLAKNHNVLAISRKNDKLSFLYNLSFLKCEFSNINRFTNEIKKFQPDILIHCAWLGGNTFADINSIIQFENITYSKEILDIFIKSGIKFFIGFGTGAEYGFHTGKVSENSNFMPYNLYGKSKNYFKAISEKICRNNNIIFSWVIPMYTYGYNDVETRFIPRIIKSCLTNEDLTLNSCNSYTDYLFIDDFVEGVESIIDHSLEGTFNISSGTTQFSKDIVNMIVNETKYEKDFTYNSNLDRVDFQDYFCSSSYKLQILSNWRPKISFEQGIKKTIAWKKYLYNI